MFSTMWIIVHFLNDNSVAAVPYIWWKNGYCAWPKKHVKNENQLAESKAKPTKNLFYYLKARKLSQHPIGNI